MNAAARMWLNAVNFPKYEWTFVKKRIHLPVSQYDRDMLDEMEANYERQQAAKEQLDTEVSERRPYGKLL